MTELSRLRIGVVVSRFNEEITTRLQEGALAELKALGIQHVKTIQVPGALEIPLAAQALLDSGCDAIVTLGAVIRGETAHFDYVCRGVERGCSQLQLQYKRPVAFGVLTTENDDQALARAGGSMGNKGAEAAQVAVEMAQLLLDLKGTNDESK